MQSSFHSNVEQYKLDISSLNKQLNRLSSLRLVVFVGALALVLILAGTKSVVFVLITLIISVCAFTVLLRQYNILLHTRNRLTFLREINEREVLIQERKLNGLDTGAEFLKADHAYAGDLDIFGQHSIFQLLNRTTTEAGKTELANWLLSPVKQDAILDRQKAAAELAQKLQWRQELQAAGMLFGKPKSSYVQLVKWIDEPFYLLPRRSRYLTSAIALGSVASLAVVLGVGHLFKFLFLGAPLSIAFLMPVIVGLIVNRRFIKKLRRQTERALDNLQACVPILAAGESLISRIESTSFSSDLLRDWQFVFRTNEYSAIKEIRRLRRILEVFQQRGSRQTIGKNDFYNLFNSIWLLDIYFILATERWKAKSGTKLKEWTAAIANFEAINSLAGFTYANPDFVFPLITEDSYQMRFANLGHPLLTEHQRICNDFDLTERGSIVMITGSNMAGKSTFLRSVGCNLVLAMAGAPCCASWCRISQMQLFTSMRSQDNLEEGISSFYAELRRIEMLLELIVGGQPVFFLLDEMFKGTNSQDRYKGGVSLIRQLSGLHAFGIVSTHDLQLAKVATQHLAVSNYSFNSVLKEEKIIFDYKLKEGFCTDFNASALMRKSGIDILPDL